MKNEIPAFYIIKWSSAISYIMMCGTRHLGLKNGNVVSVCLFKIWKLQVPWKSKRISFHGQHYLRI